MATLSAHTTEIRHRGKTENDPEPRARAVADEQLETMGIGHHPEVTTRTFLLAAFLLPGAHLLTLIHERLGRLMRDELGLPLRLLEPPTELRPITEVMLWTSRHCHDAGLAWLRQRMHTLTSEL